MAGKLEIKSLAELEAMHTGTLMNRRAALLKCEESFEASDCYGYERKPSPDMTGVIEFKDSPEWQNAYKNLKNVLATRDHYPNKKERKEIRRSKAKSSR